MAGCRAQKRSGLRISGARPHPASEGSRPLSKEEAREVTHMARRIAAILLLTPELNANHTDVKDNACAWPQPGAE